MSYSATQFATRYVPFTYVDDEVLVAALAEKATQHHTVTAPGRPRRRFRPYAAAIATILALDAVVLAVAAMIVGGSAGAILGYSIIPVVFMAATVVVCLASYDITPAPTALTGNALRRSQIRFPNA